MYSESAPVIVGAVGGSGTRVVARLISKAGVYVGARLNEAEDSEPIMAFYDAWLRRYLEAGCQLPDDERNAAESMLRERLREHLAGRVDSAQPWAIKVPRNILALPLWFELFPAFRFVHVIRNGRDMAYSTDRNQLRMFGDLILGEKEQGLPDAVREVAYWRQVNLAAADFGESRLGDRYLTLRFEDVCDDPKRAYRRLCEFLELRRPATRPRKATQGIDSPPTLGRWKERPRDELAAITAAGGRALERFGYGS
jgi:hypothetical protein